MRIVINDIAASSGGALSILRDLYEYIKLNDVVNDWTFLLSDRYIEETDRIKVILLPEVKSSKIKKLKFDLLSGKRFIKELKPDVVISMQNIITFGLRCPQIVYIHQSIPFQDIKKFSFLKKEERALAIYQYLIGMLIKESAKKSQLVVAQTEWMKKAVSLKAKVPEDKIIKVTPKVAEIDFGISKFDNKSFFYPTAPAIYKNNECIYNACDILNRSGINDFKVKLTIDGQKEYSNIEFVGRLSRESVWEEYSNSTLIFPSYIESLGYPPLEARQTGSLILASDCPFTRETLEGYENAYFFNPFKPNELAQLMRKVIQGEIIIKPTQSSRIHYEDGWDKMLKEIERVSK